LKPIEIKANIRQATGNGPARSLRRQGKLPAVLYGPGREPVLLSIQTHELEQVAGKGQVGQQLLNLTLDDREKHPAMIKELQRHPVTGTPLHVDFYEIAMDRKISVKVPVVTTGKCRGVEMGGMLQIIRRELEVACFPGQIPEVIEVDISELDIGDSVHVQEIPLESGVEIASETNFTVMTVLSPKMEAEEETEEEEAEALAEGEEETETEAAE